MSIFPDAYSFLPYVIWKSDQIQDSLLFFVTGLFFMVKSCLTRTQPPSWRHTPCQLSAAAYSIYLQLRSIAGGRLLHLQTEDAPCCGDRGPT
jgi:hypothetical protein